MTKYYKSNIKLKSKYYLDAQNDCKFLDEIRISPCNEIHHQPLTESKNTHLAANEYIYLLRGNCYYEITLFSTPKQKISIYYHYTVFFLFTPQFSRILFTHIWVHNLNGEHVSFDI